MSTAEEREKRLQLLEDDIGRSLRESQRNGELASAPSFGKPLNFGDGYDETPAELRMPYKMLKDAGFVPPEVEALKQIEQLQQQIKGVQFNGDYKGQSLYTVLNVSFPKTERSEMILFNLDMQGICVSGGSACSSGADVGSHVIRAINNNPNLVPVRFSFCKHNTREEVDAVIGLIRDLL